ncbi:hypothetical protein TWF506_009769 [Arthrobotrys conoides]|uniref:Uncharacterized protein n=1 Tax=Arthrobotrys conoides TaxID=74498 RepID=A0AAN8NLR0_9PEZI
MAFQGLRNLDVFVSQEEDYLEPAPILHHAETLKRLALWKVVQHNTQIPMMPIPSSLMKSLGEGLSKLEELCATLPREHDPFEGNRFPKLKLLWLYNNNPNRSSIDFTPEYPWIPPTNDEIKYHPEWILKNSTLQLDLTAHPSLTIPKNLTALAIGHYNRVVDLEAELNLGFDGNLKCTERLYERILEDDDRIVWRRIGMRELARVNPELLSPYEDAFGVRLMKRHYIFNSTEIDGVLDPLDALPDGL